MLDVWLERADGVERNLVEVVLGGAGRRAVDQQRQDGAQELIAHLEVEVEQLGQLGDDGVEDDQFAKIGWRDEERSFNLTVAQHDIQMTKDNLLAGPRNKEE